MASSQPQVDQIVPVSTKMALPQPCKAHVLLPFMNVDSTFIDTPIHTARSLALVCYWYVRGPLLFDNLFFFSVACRRMVPSTAMLHVYLLPQ